MEDDLTQELKEYTIYFSGYIRGSYTVKAKDEVSARYDFEWTYADVDRDDMDYKVLGGRK